MVYCNNIIIDCEQDELQAYGIDWDGPPSVENDEGVTVPLIPCPLEDDRLHEMYELINPLSHSLDFGVDLFTTTLDYVYRHTH